VLPTANKPNAQRSVRWPFLVLLALGLAAFTAVWYASSPPDKSAPRPAFGGAYVEGVAGVPLRLNPLLEGANDVDASLDALIFAGLTLLDDQGRALPNLAGRWDISDDGRTYVFHLRPNLLWHDGIPLTAADVLFTYRLASDPDLTPPPPLARVLADAILSAPDVQTLVVQLPQPFAPLPAYLSLGVLPQHLLAGATAATLLESSFNRRPVGSGPFRLEDLDSDHALLTPNPAYHFGQPYIQRFEVRFFRDEGTLLAAARGGLLDGAYFPAGVSAHDLEGLQGAPGVRTRSLPGSDVTLVYFNNQAGALRDPRVRRALYFALDRAALSAGDLSGETQMTNSPLPPGTWAYSGALGRLGPDAVRSAALLDDAGYRLDGAGVRRRAGAALSVELTTSDDPVRTALANEIAHCWQALGLQAKVTPATTTALTRETLPSRAFEALLFSYRAEPDPDPYPIWYSSEAGRHGGNLAAFGNSRADRLLEDGRAAVTPEKRAAVYRDFQDLFAEEMPAIPLFSSTALYAQKASVQGARPGYVSSPGARFWQVQDWYLRTR